MLHIIFVHRDGTQQKLEAFENWSILQLAKHHGITELEGVCGGSLACASCHVVIAPDWAERVAAQDNEKTEEEEDILDLAFNTQPTSRLGCQVKFTKALNGLVVILP